MMDLKDINNGVDLPPQLKEAIEAWTKKYPAERRQSAVLPALTLAQEYNRGYLSLDLIDSVADYLKMPRMIAYEVATFYNLYELKPVGHYKIGVCTNISCMLNGCDQIVKRLMKCLKISFGQTTPDGRFTLKEMECLGACINPPVISVGRRYYEGLTPKKIDKILDTLNGE